MNKRVLFRIPCLLLFFFVALTGYGQGFLKADGKKIVNEKGEEVILRGMGLGGWMLQEGYMLQIASIASPQHQIRAKIKELVGEEKTKTFYDAWLANHCRKVDIDSLAAWGFNSVRLPMHYNLYTLPIELEPVPGKNTWLDKGFALTDSLVKWCKANHIYVILDLHGAPGGQGHDAAISDYESNKPSLWESEANQKKTVALWRKLAERYANEPAVGGYDVINEPNWGFQNATDLNGCAETGNVPLRKLMVEITTAIREVDTKHMIFVEGNCWGNNHQGLFPLWDNNLVISFHKYWSYNDEGSISGVLGIRDQYNVPLWLGESGENSNSWFRGAIELVEKNRIGWAWWPQKKLGYSCPTEVKVNAGYQTIMDYWNGKAAKPSEADAFASLMQLTENLKLENTIYHKDIIDAMFRQVQTAAPRPFQPHTIPANTKLFAVEYDLGRVGSAYYDVDTADYHVTTQVYTAWNSGYTYRNDGVDIEMCKDDITNGFNVGWTQDAEWLQYTVNVTATGIYDLHLRTASANANGRISLTANGLPITGSIALPATGGFSTWGTTIVKDIYLVKGVNALRVKMDKGGFNFNYLDFAGPRPATPDVQPILLSAKVNATGDAVVLTFNQPFAAIPAQHGFTVQVNENNRTIKGASLQAGYDQVITLLLDKPITYGDVVLVNYAGTAVTTAAGTVLNDFSKVNVQVDLTNPLTLNWIPGKVEAENVSVAKGINTENCSDAGGGKNVGYIDAGDFLVYNVTIQQTGTYQIDYRTAGQSATGKLNVYVVENNQSTLLETVDLAATGGWQTWKTTTGKVVSLTQGPKAIRLEIAQGGFNFNWLTFNLLNVPDAAPLQFVSGSTNSDGKKLLLTFNKALANQSLTNQGFRLLVDGKAKALGTVSLNGSKGLALTISEPVKPGAVLKIAYDGSGPIQSEKAQALEAFDYQLIKNVAMEEAPPLAVPGRLEAEAFAVNMGFQMETTTDVGGGQNVGYTDPGDYLDFVVMVAEAGTYTVGYRVASESATGSVKLQLIDANGTATDLHPSLSFGPSGGWQTWQTVTAEVVLPPGKRTIRVLAEAANFNLNWIELALKPVVGPLGIDEMLASLISVYPNPCQQTFVVNLEGVSEKMERITIKDMAGKELLVVTPDRPASQVLINHTFSRGMYLLVIEAKGRSAIKKLLIQ